MLQCLLGLLIGKEWWISRGIKSMHNVVKTCQEETAMQHPVELVTLNTADNPPLIPYRPDRI